MTRPFAIPLPPSAHDQRAERPDKVNTRLENLGNQLYGGIRRFFSGRRGIQAAVARIEGLSEQFVESSDKELSDIRAKVREDLLRDGFTDSAVAASFALIRETSRRILGLYHYPCQLFGGIAMLQGKVAEMDTGEGKTLTATLAAATAAMARIPVHVVSVNDYLTGRDAETMGPLYRALGLEVGCVTHNMKPDEKRHAYSRDITYVTNKELVFDYLRDRLTLGDRTDVRLLRAEYLHSRSQRSDRLLIRGLYFGIVDEADSILIDEARTPLIISGTAGEEDEKEFLRQALDIAATLEEGDDFLLDRQRKSLRVTEQGRKQIETKAAGLGPMWNGLVRRESTVFKALQAQYMFHLDENYLVRDGKIQIIDEFTGRVMEGRSWEQGLHQMIEMKEGCDLTSRRETLAKISYQRFFRRYLHLSGMTGTAREVAGELWNVYNLQTLKIPPNKPPRRKHLPDKVFAHEVGKWQAVSTRILAIHEEGRPVLVGTRSVKASEKLAGIMREHGLAYELLNAKQDAEEAAIIQKAGEVGAVTIATNMAGRGTDIKLTEEVQNLGGLHVISTERHEAARIDRQLAGRSGRQGDPGSYEALLSFDDMLFTGQRGRLLAKVGRMIPAPHKGLGGVLSRWLLNRAQKRLEKYHDKMRKELFKQDQAQGSLLSFSGNLE
ncbi:preprotein translocase subunit SecA [Desulforhopalus vacuolatus]|uniref:preprotein translocase subunit SecA n=1 Tax=Desulforhopalus vacuolatus TaxID=40414 RepID=UPI001962E42E|nr:preprotein translocase subunit SecA [Desulforhopalus vacuolatus]MBM9518791.1 preprotein translocase subunit SecA [Desulforhopalus vacuolatus]